MKFDGELTLKNNLPYSAEDIFCGSLDLGFQVGTEDSEGLPCNISCQDCGANGPWTYVKEEELERDLPIIPLDLWNKRS